MLNVIKLALAALFIPLLTPVVHAELGDSQFIWDNEAGFVPSEDCKVEFSTKDELLAVGAGGFFTEQGVRVNTLDGTIMKRLGGRGSQVHDGEVHRPVRVLATPGEVEMTCDRVGVRGEIGYVSDKILVPINQFEIKIRSVNGVSPAVQDSVRHVKGWVWRVASSNGANMYYVCGRAKKRYLVFNLYTSNKDILPVARLGVWSAQTQIFADIDVRRRDVPAAVTSKDQGTPIENLNPELNPPPELTMEEIRRTFQIPLPRGADEPGEKNYAGQRCLRTDSDPLKCMVCVIQYEAEHNHFAGMVAVGRTMMERLAHPLYPKDLCKIAHQPGQYVAVWNGRPITNDRQQAAKITSAAKEAMARGGQGFTGFRACSYLRGIGNTSGVNIGNNCFLRNGFLQEPLVPGAPEKAPKTQMAEKAKLPQTL